MLGTILIVILILLLIGALPAWPYSTGWGYYPGGGLGLILIIVIVLVVSRKNMTAGLANADRTRIHGCSSPAQRSNPGP